MLRLTILIYIPFLSLSVLAQTIEMPPVHNGGMVFNFDQIENNSSPSPYEDKGPWDFSSVNTTSVYEMKLLPINHSSSAKNYPKATHFISSQNGEFFYTYEGNEILNYGRITDNTESSYSEPVVWMKFPLTSTSQFSDVTNSDFKFNGYDGTIEDKCESQVLGVSSLTLPNGTKYENAILVKTVKSMAGQVGPLASTIIEQGKYWWVPGVPLPVAAFEQFFLNTSKQYERSSFLKEEKLLSTGKLDQHSFHIYPNPTAGRLVIQLKAESNVTIYDLKGKVVFHALFAPGSQIVDFENNPSGKYVLVVNDFKSTKRQVLLKQ